MSDMSQWGWTVDGYQLKFRRVITAVDGNQISLDAPIVQTIEDQYGGGDIYKYSYTGELEKIGFECLRLESTYISPTDENHGWTAIKINRLQNGWVRQVTGRYFGYGLVTIKGNSQQITVEDCAMLDHKSVITGGRRYSFNIDDSQLLLIQRCLAREGRHDFASGSKTPGPNVFVDCRADRTHADIGPHHRYATGQIYDNVMGGEINVQNRQSSGSGHGWAGAQILFWNCDASSIICDAPNGAMNWCVGSRGTKVEGYWAREEPFGIWDSYNVPVTPRSLFYTQLAERLGANALNTVILPRQKEGNIWSDLFMWDGDGLFGDDVVAWTDEQTDAYAGYPFAVRGTIRNLQMLDRGATNLWTKVSGPGAVSFDDETAMQTVVTCSQAGEYVLELTVDDGVSPVGATVAFTVNTGGPETAAPAVPTGLGAMGGDGSVSLNWDDNQEMDLAGYSVYRSTTSGTNYLLLETNLASSAYIDNTAGNGTTYYYVVSAIDINTNESAQSAEVSATPGEGTTPAAPIGLGAVAGDNLVSLSWDDNSEPGITGYNIYRSNISGSFGSTPFINVLSGSYSDRSVVEGTTYYYKVTAVDGFGNESPMSEEVSATPMENQAPVITFIEPLDGQSVPVRTNLYVYVNAADTNGSVDNIKLFINGIFVRQENRAPYEWGAESQYDPLLQNMTAGTYVLEAVATDNLGALSTNSITITVGADTEPPAAPANLTAVPGDALVSLDWDDNTELDLAGYSVYRSTAQGTNHTLLVSNLTSSAHIDNTALNDTAYYYAVTAWDASGNESARSKEVPVDVSEWTGYDQWAIEWGAEIGTSTNDFDSDGLNNLYEYGLGGNPTNPAAHGTLPVFTKSGTRLLYVHPQRSDDASLIYTVLTTTNLMTGMWTNEGYAIMGTNVTGETLDFVTNELDTVKNEKFIRLKIEK
jgi:fibronectin type 3 domain-containing protein